MQFKLVHHGRQIISPSSNTIVADLVHFIDHRDIERYIYNKFIGEPATPEIRHQMNAELRCLENELKGSGYEITHIHALEVDITKKIEKEYKERLKRDTAKYRHEISVLQKKLNKIQEAING